MSKPHPITGPQAQRPTPVVDGGKLAGLLSALVVAVGGGLVLLGVATTQQVTAWSVVVASIVTAAIALATYLLPLWQAHKAAALVTPTADPQDDTGAPLVPSTVDLTGSVTDDQPGT